MAGNETRKGQQGFSLLEIIMAVGLLSLVSLYLLQIFVTAVRLNHQAADLDESVQLSNNVIQLLDGGLEKERLESQLLFHQAVIEQEGHTTRLSMSYDDDWQPISVQTAANQASYELRVNTVEEAHAGGSLVAVNLEVVRHRPYLMKKEAPTVIYQMEAQRFLPSEGGGQP